MWIKNKTLVCVRVHCIYICREKYIALHDYIRKDLERKICELITNLKKLEKKINGRIKIIVEIY